MQAHFTFCFCYKEDTLKVLKQRIHFKSDLTETEANETENMAKVGIQIT